MRTLYVVAVWLHLIGAMTWIGGMAVLGAAVMPEIRALDEPVRSRFQWRFLGRFRTLMWSAYGLSGTAGGLLLWLRGVRWSHLADPHWLNGSFGRLLLPKLALFLISGILVFLHERTPARNHARHLGRITFALGLAIVLLGVLLVRGW